ncbi:bifunctional cobalt-precorrin-7 (C(5))-methyltransferase/cobalt-precorrin-6B (C(15))-methyltransferase [Desulfopila aestuarii]|uniref:tRNA (guanine(46)-N(7))-methyltransferase n=1 Tax=Desulfopila aestuarii DSM 18488 TaxID=1121416 RepID=A0A1M7Y163_9BACT|nr:bifunctional cobalt-precorrin-7 (C(5))-methyltransferase/cobalt-precorrin-6B (C(15))-methyltransferase [Desulfopila aestuarii]SHO45431.1 precorrin-6Y C5,15-methyltransferase (decarboxylating) [Desulfopila aestuarii DSM 18488]
MTEGIIRVIGVDQQGEGKVNESMLAGCKAVVLTGRFHCCLPASAESLQRIPISPLTGAIESIRDHLSSGDVAVLASGDPLFFGIGKKLIKEFGRNRVKITPAVSSLQYAFARFAIPWDDAAFVSLHGRKHHNRVAALLTRPLTAVLTDNINRPEMLAAELLQFVGKNDEMMKIHVAENLGMPDERCVSGTLAEIAAMTFGNLSCMIIVRNEVSNSSGKSSFGLIEDEIIHSRGLITKNEVRASALHALAIPANAIMWDIGAGSGSVSIEAARMQPDTLVYAIEKEEEQQHNILANIARYGVANIQLVSGGAPEMLAGLPRPDRIFVGGSGGNLAEILRHGADELLPDGRIVVSAVLEKTRKEAPEILYQCGLKVDLRQIEVRRCCYPSGQTTTFNPITLIVGRSVSR